MTDVSKEVLQKEIKVIVSGANLKTLTSRVVRELLQKKLEINLLSRKKEVDALIMAEIEDKTASHSEEEASEDEAPPPQRKKKHESESDAEVEDGDEKDDDDDYKPIAKKGRGAPPKSKGAKKKKSGSEDRESDEDWGKAKKAKKVGGGGRGKQSAFTKAFKLSPELADLVGSDVMPRHEVVKKVWAVIKERELQDPKNKQFAICDDQLLKVFGVKRFRTFGMMKHLKEHFLEAA